MREGGIRIHSLLSISRSTTPRTLIFKGAISEHYKLLLIMGKASLFLKWVPHRPTWQIPGVSILTSYGENPHYVKLPIFSEFMENSTKFMKNSDLTKWTQNLREEDQNRFQGPGVHCLKIEATHQINVFISVFCCIGDHIWQKHCISFINT